MTRAPDGARHTRQGLARGQSGPGTLGSADGVPGDPPGRTRAREWERARRPAGGTGEGLRVASSGRGECWCGLAPGHPGRHEERPAERAAREAAERLEAALARQAALAASLGCGVLVLAERGRPRLVSAHPSVPPGEVAWRSPAWRP